MIDTQRRRGLPGLAYPEEYLKRLAGELAAQPAPVDTARVAGIALMVAGVSLARRTG